MYRVNPTKRAMMQQEVSYLVEHGLAVPSTSAWSSPCVLVPKPDNTSRFCNDYRKVNSVTKPDSFPLPRMEDCIDRVGSAKYVTKLDLLKGYWQVPLTPRASEISAFVTPDPICAILTSGLCAGLSFCRTLICRFTTKVSENVIDALSRCSSDV